MIGYRAVKWCGGEIGRMPRVGTLVSHSCDATIYSPDVRQEISIIPVFGGSKADRPRGGQDLRRGTFNCAESVYGMQAALASTLEVRRASGREGEVLCGVANATAKVTVAMAYLQGNSMESQAK